MMRTKIAGINLFGQFFDNKENIISEFTNLTLPEQFKFNDINILKQKWSFNLFLCDRDIYIAGAVFRKISSFCKLMCPFNIDDINEDLLDSGDDETILVVCKKSNALWQCWFVNEIEPKWKQITPFISVESPGSKSEIVKIVAKGLLKLCLTRDGSVYQLPQKINTECCDSEIVDIDCGNNHDILLSKNGSVYTWGHGRRCQLGHGDLENKEELQCVDALAGIKIKKISAGGWHNCALSVDGDLYVWGWNEAGQLGLKTSSNIDKEAELKSYCEPQLVDFFNENESFEANVIDVACGNKHTLVLLNDNSVWASGWNKYSQLGLDSKLYPQINFFRKVLQHDTLVRLKCGHWSSVIETKS